MHDNVLRDACKNIYTCETLTQQRTAKALQYMVNNNGFG